MSIRRSDPFRPGLIRVSVLLLIAVVNLQGCSSGDPPSSQMARDETAAAPGSFGEAVAFLEQHTDVVVLDDGSGGLVTVLPDMQGRVMTSTTGGAEGLSLGWINRKLISSGETLEHMNPYGGEDRFWIGPEGGQFSVFFSKGDPFDLEHWQTPAPFDTEPFEVVDREPQRVRLQKRMRLENYSGTVFSVGVQREVRLIPAAEVANRLGVSPGASVEMVAFESENTITNAGDNAWTEDSGLLSIWILGMFNPSPATTVVVPFNAGAETELGPVVNDSYFGKVPADRLIRGDGVLYFSGDGAYRSKIGLTPGRAKSMLGSFDAQNGILTIVHYTKPSGATRYVNSMWEIQDAPYGGDVVNSYNDGPPEPGADPLGPFYELETSSPAAALDPGSSLTHVHSTFHFRGTEADLDAIALATLGVSISDIKGAL